MQCCEARPRRSAIVCSPDKLIFERIQAGKVAFDRLIIDKRKAGRVDWLRTAKLLPD